MLSTSPALYSPDARTTFPDLWPKIFRYCLRYPGRQNDLLPSTENNWLRLNGRVQVTYSYFPAALASVKPKRSVQIKNRQLLPSALRKKSQPNWKLRAVIGKHALPPLLLFPCESRWNQTQAKRPGFRPRGDGKEAGKVFLFCLNFMRLPGALAPHSPSLRSLGYNEAKASRRPGFWTQLCIWHPNSVGQIAYSLWASVSLSVKGKE